MNTRVVFMGSPEFAIPTLEALAKQYDVAGVITQPDRPAGRGRVLTPPPVKRLADALGIATIQPERLKAPEAQAKLLEWSPDLIVVAAFGQILRKSVLELPRYGCVNVHASLLPRWRGAAPIQAAILHGDAATGATIMMMDPGIDTGPVLAQERTEIRPDDTAEILSERLAKAGANLLMRTLPGYLAGAVIPRQQDETQATYAPMLKKEEGLLDFSQPAEDLERKVRAFYPWPGAFLAWAGGILKVHRAHVEPHLSPVFGKHYLVEGLPAVGARSGLLALDEVQPAGKRPMSGRDFARGARNWTEA